MASEAEATEIPSLFERLLRHRDMSLFLPFILGFTRENPENSQNPDEETLQTSERIIIIDPLTQGMMVIEGTSNLDSVLRNLGSKDGQPPASKASVEAMPRIKIGESEKEELGVGGECVVCLEEYEVGEVAKEMPCKHKFHANCIEKWLGIHGSCPVCRYKMPVDEEESSNKRDDQRREIWVSFSFNSGRRSGDSNPNETASSSGDSTNVSDSSSPSSTPDQEIES